MDVVHVKYCNHLLAVDMAGVACRGLCMHVHVVGKMSKDIGMGVRKGTVVSFVPTNIVVALLKKLRKKIDDLFI